MIIKLFLISYKSRMDWKTLTMHLDSTHTQSPMEHKLIHQQCHQTK